jgi:hypothetical protein
MYRRVVSPGVLKKFKFVSARMFIRGLVINIMDRNLPRN